MNLDLRIPLGLMFTLTGMILSAFGLATNDKPGFYAQSMGINVNLWWGIVLMVFGWTMFMLARRSLKRSKSPPSNALKKKQPRRR